MSSGNGYDAAMPRKPFIPDAHQTRLLAALERQAKRVDAEDQRLTEMIAEAIDAGVTVSAIADKLDIERKTVYARLARSADGDHGAPAPHSAP